MHRPPERPLRLAGAALALGLISILAFAPVGASPLIFLTLGGLVVLLEEARQTRSTQRGAWIGGTFGFALFLGGVSWIYVSLSTFGGMPPALAGLSTVLFCAFLALYPALTGALYVRFAPETIWQRGLFFASQWVLCEWLRGWLFTGFPWLAVGYSQTPPSPLAGFAPILGIYGVSALTATVAALAGLAFVAWRRRGLAAVLRAHVVPIALVLVAGGLLREISWTQPIEPPIRVALLQGNIPQELKWRPEWFTESLRTYHRLADEHPAQLTVLPETAIPSFLNQLPDGYIDALRGLALRENGELILGVATGDSASYANSALAIGASGTQRYDKHHLVPFGEFVPPGFRWLMSMAQIPMSDFRPGAPRQAPLNVGPLKVAANICYEDAFGEEIIRALPEAHLLVNLSNVAWFGDSLAPSQHLQIAQMRALEAGRMMLRATNTGMTAIIASDGRVIDKLPPFTRGALSGEVRAYAGSTPFVLGGNLPIVILSALCIAFLRRRNTVS